MKTTKILGAVGIMACMIPGIRALAQASIVENQSNTIYVNTATGADTNPGTSAKSIKTIQAAVNKALTLAKSGVGSKVMIAPGTYRETVTINNYAGSAPITMQAATAGTVVVDGADVLTDWHLASPGIYEYTWKDTVTGCSLPSGWYTGMPPVVQANEMVFVNGASMTQVMSASQLHPGTFYVNISGEQVQVDPPSGTNMASATVEVAARRSTLAVNSSKNLVFRNMVFQHAASCMNLDGATVGGSSNVMFANDVAEWNNWGGIGVDNSHNVTVENTIGNFNGGPGLSGYEDLDSLWQNNETDYNNQRGAMVGLYDFAEGGTKLMRAHTATVSGQKSYNNASQGLWFDTDNMNITITGATLIGNLVGNLQMEANEGPFTVSNSTLCNGGGIQMINTANITLTGNKLYNNGGASYQNAQLFLAGNPGGRIVTNWQTGAKTNVYTKGLKLTNNDIIAVGSNENVFNTYESGNDWAEFIDSVTATGNHWYDSAKTTAFVLSGNKSTNLAGWEKASKSGKGDVWGSVSVSCSVPSTTFPDFQILAHNAASYISGYSMSGGVVNIPIQVRSFNYGAVKLSATGMPSGVTATFSTSSLTSGSSTLTLKASGSAPTETAFITIFGISGNRVHTITLKIAIKK